MARRERAHGAREPDWPLNAEGFPHREIPLVFAGSVSWQRLGSQPRETWSPLLCESRDAIHWGRATGLGQWRLLCDPESGRTNSPRVDDIGGECRLQTLLRGRRLPGGAHKLADLHRLDLNKARSRVPRLMLRIKWDRFVEYAAAFINSYRIEPSFGLPIHNV